MKTEPQKESQRENPKPKKNIDRVARAGPHSNANEYNCRRAGVKDCRQPARNEARATTTRTLNLTQKNPNETQKSPRETNLQKHKRSPKGLSSKAAETQATKMQGNLKKT